MTARIGASGKIAAVVISLISSSAFAAVVALPQYNVSFNDVSVSGLSSGAYRYRTPLSGYWNKFKEAYYVMESEHIELGRMTKDGKAMDAVVRARAFACTTAVSNTYRHLIEEFSADRGVEKQTLQQKELVAIAVQEQVNVLQPLIYNDLLLKETMDTNHRFSRLTNGWLSPKFKVIYSSAAHNEDPELETVFDVPDQAWERIFGDRKSLPSQNDRMLFVDELASDFDRLMTTKRVYMDGELRKIAAWLSA